MKLTIDIKTILAAINRAKPVASGPTTLPVLSCFLLTATDKLTIAANNLDLFISTDAECSVSEKGSVCISARRFAEVIAALGSGEADISTDTKHFMSIRRGAALIRLSGLSDGEFPPTDSFESAHSITLPADGIRAALLKLSPFMSVDASRYVLCGIAMQSDGGKFIMVSTNGRVERVVRFERDAPSLSVIVPSGAVALLSKLLDSGDVGLSFSDSAMRASGDGWTVTTKLIEGDFPNWKQVIPDKKDFKLSAVAPRDAWLDAVSVASVTTQQTKDLNGSMKLDITKRGTDVHTNFPDVGDSSIPVDGATATGDLQIAFGVDYFRQVVGSFEDGETRIQFIDALSPLKIEDETGLAILMSMRVN